MASSFVWKLKYFFTRLTWFVTVIEHPRPSESNYVRQRGPLYVSCVLLYPSSYIEGTRFSPKAAIQARYIKLPHVTLACYWLSRAQLLSSGEHKTPHCLALQACLPRSHLGMHIHALNRDPGNTGCNSSGGGTSMFP